MSKNTGIFKILSIISLACFCLVGCDKKSTEVPVYSISGNVEDLKVYQIPLSDFNSIVVEEMGQFSVHLRVSKSDEPFAILSAYDDKVRDSLITDVEEGVLRIAKKDLRLSHASDYTLYLNTPHLEKISMGYRGSVTIGSGFETDSFRLELTGNVIEVESHINANQYSLEVDGGTKADVEINGDIDSLDCLVEGEAIIDALDANAGVVDLTVTGIAPSIKVQSDVLNVDVASYANIYYAGTPQINSTGAGKETLILLEEEE